MISRAFEWYRIAEVKPTSETIDKRVAAVSDLIKAIDDAKDWDLALGCAAGVVAGFEFNFMQDSPVVQSIVGAIRAHESAFAQDLSENALALRACAAIALGEILVRNGNKPPDADALVIASVLRPGLAARPLPKARHLKQLLDELDNSAANILESGAVSRRRRFVTLGQQFEKLQEPADLPAAWKSLVPALKAVMKELTQQSAIDREEINILWWMFAGASTTVGQPIAQMPAGAAVLCCGAELGSECLVPPTRSLEAMIRRAYEPGRKAQEMTDISIEKVVADWDVGLLNVLVPDDNAKEFARKNPMLLPFSWLCDRLLASNGATGWAAEFERTTHTPAKHARSYVDWAIQAFRERVAYRLYSEFEG